MELIPSWFNLRQYLNSLDQFIHYCEWIEFSPPYNFIFNASLIQISGATSNLIKFIRDYCPYLKQLNILNIKPHSITSVMSQVQQIIEEIRQFKVLYSLQISIPNIYIPPQLFTLNIQVLKLEKQYFTADDIGQISQKLPYIRILYLFAKRISICYEQFKVISKLKLEGLGLYCKNMKEQNKLIFKQIPNLKELYLEVDAENQIVLEIAKMKVLERLFLPGSEIELQGIKQLGYMPFLTQIDLTRSKLNTQMLSHIYQFQKINVSDCQLSNDEALQICIHNKLLTQLNLSENSQISSETISIIILELPKLVVLDLSSCHFSRHNIISIGHSLSSLTNLYIDKCLLNDQSIYLLCSLKVLKKQLKMLKILSLTINSEISSFKLLRNFRRIVVWKGNNMSSVFNKKRHSRSKRMSLFVNWTTFL